MLLKLGTRHQHWTVILDFVGHFDGVIQILLQIFALKLAEAFPYYLPAILNYN